MVTLETLSYLSTAPDQFIDITEDVHAAIERSSVTNGLAAIILSHTTCGIVVNEGLPCVETDLMETLDRIAPLDAPYAHAHFLPSYGATGNNSCGHIKSMIVETVVSFPSKMATSCAEVPRTSILRSLTVRRSEKCTSRCWGSNVPAIAL